MPKLGGGYEGFNIDLANEIAKRLKRNSVIDAAQFSGIVPALQAGTYDYVAAPTTVTKERADNMLFTEGYLNTDFQFLIKKGRPKVEKLEDLKGKIVSVNKGSAYDSWARDLEAKIGWKIESYGTQTDAVQAVLVGRADANVAGNTVIAWCGQEQPAARAVVSLQDRAGLGGAAAQGFRRAAQDRRERDRMHEARRHHRENAREVVRH
jgi:polar amino acid transport system substrate-binding protein